MHAEAKAFLIRGLPQELVLIHILPRLPWYTRPVCRAISKSWKAFIDSCNTSPSSELELKTRHHQLPLLKGLFLVCTSDLQVFITIERVSHTVKDATYYAIRRHSDPADKEWRCFDEYHINCQWRKLPSLHDLLPSYRSGARVVASAGRVYLWSDDKPDLVLKMDMGRGDWTWKKFVLPHPLDGNAIAFKGKIYIPRALVDNAPTNQERMELVLVYDMMTDQFARVEAWSRDNLRAIPKKSSCLASDFEEELYSFAEQGTVFDGGKLELLVYDSRQDSWGMHAEMPFPEYQWSEFPQVQLLTGDSFKPALVINTNIVWIDYENEVITWFDSAVRKAWVPIEYDSQVEGLYLESLQFIHGALYAVFCEDKDLEDTHQEVSSSNETYGEKKRGDEEDMRLWKRTIRKGMVSVESTSMEWVEMHEIGFFEESYCMGMSVDLPIYHFTVMT